MLAQLACWPDPGAAGISELARELRLTKNQIFRLLKTLERHHLVRQEPETSRYRLGPGLLFLAHGARERMSLVRAAAPVLDELAVATGESIHLVERHGLEAVVVDLRESLQPVRLTARLGGRYPLHAGASPKAILAFLPPAWQERVLSQLPGYPCYTPRTVMDPGELRGILARVRERGYAVSDEDVDPGARAVGAAIFDPAGLPRGAVSIAGPAFRLPMSVIERYGALVRRAAADISVRMGALPPGTRPSRPGQPGRRIHGPSRSFGSGAPCP